MKRICLLLLLCLPLIFTGNHANAHDVRALAVVPNPFGKVAVLPGHQAEVTETFNSAGQSIGIQKAGVHLEVRSAVIADGYGLVAMIAYGSLLKGEKEVASLSEGQTINKIGWNLVVRHIHEAEVVHCIAIGQYIADSEAKTGGFTLKGKSVYATSSSRETITINVGAASFSGGGGEGKLKTRKPMFHDRPFTIKYIELHKCSACGKALPKDTKEACKSTQNGKHSFQSGNSGNGNNNGGSDNNNGGNNGDVIILDENGNYDNGDNETPTPGITLANPGQTFQPGDSVTLDIVTADPFYSVSWYVHTPGDTSSSGTYQYDNYGDGTSTLGSFFYTIPSGAMHTGDYLFRAVIYRWSDMFYVGAETYTVTVQ